MVTMVRKGIQKSHVEWFLIIAGSAENLRV